VNADEFRDRVLSILRKEFPEEEFKTDGRQNLIAWRDAEFGLHTLHADANRLKVDDEQLRLAVIAHFSRLIKMTELSKGLVPTNWNSASGRVRLQLMPAEFCRTGVSVTYPFLDEVVISVVIDSEYGYAYVRHEDLERWQISPFDLYEIARENLKLASEGVEVSFIDGPSPIIAIQSQDGYDAVRVLLPEMRQFAEEKLGTPFYAAIPNRDFLIMWTAGADEDFHLRIKSQILRDHVAQSHPLTSTILKVTEESIVPYGIPFP
jgi:Protein of unknown function (DUF1444)